MGNAFFSHLDVGIDIWPHLLGCGNVVHLCVDFSIDEVDYI